MTNGVLRPEIASRQRFINDHNKGGVLFISICKHTTANYGDAKSVEEVRTDSIALGSGYCIVGSSLTFNRETGCVMRWKKRNAIAKTHRSVAYTGHYADSLQNFLDKSCALHRISVGIFFGIIRNG